MKKRAFTLIELIITLAIISMIASVIMIKTGIISKFEEKKEVENIISDFNYCREKSLATGNDFEMQLKGDNYKIIKWSDNTSVKEVNLKYLTSLKTYSMTFKPTGSVGKANTIVVNSKYNTYKIVVSPIAGRIRSEKEKRVYSN